MTTFFTADLHFGHENIIRYCDRPYWEEWQYFDGTRMDGKPAVESMNEDIVLRWNSTIDPDDTVYILGDLCMGKLKESLKYVQFLNGYKILMPGNHDKMFNDKSPVSRQHSENLYTDAGINAILYGPSFYESNFYDYPVLLNHFPYKEPPIEGQTSDRFASCRPKDTGFFLLHGHTHGLWRQNGRMIDVGLDAWRGLPVAEEEIVWLMKQGVNSLPKIQWMKGG